ncbi:MAG TPA: flavin reductase, partial [Methanomicrobiales archaeon]|nr:flavin reductase [Methanomicrobiales archaeon]
PVRGEKVDDPYVGEFPVVLECRVREVVEIGLHTQFIGEILDVKADESVVGSTGVPEMKRVNPLLFDPGARTYYGVGDYLGKAFHIGRLL